MAFEPDPEESKGGFVPDDPSMWEKLKNASPLLIHGIPGGAGMLAMKALDKLAYKSGGAVTDVLAPHVPPGVAAAGGLAANVAVQAAPSVIGGTITARLAPEIQSGAKSVMQSALKPPKEMLVKGKAAEAIDTLLKEGANVTPGGVAKLQDKISLLNDEIMEAVKSSGAKIDVNKVATSLEFARKKFMNQVLWQKDSAVVDKAWREFLSNPLFRGKENIPVQIAQKLKQGTYQMLGSKPYGELSSAETEAAKSLAHGLKEEIAKAVPGIDKLNKAESELLNAKIMAELRVLVDLNKDPGGITWLAHNPVTALAWLSMRSPFIKSLLAQGLYHGAKPIATLPGQVAGAVYGGAVLGSQEQ